MSSLYIKLKKNCSFPLSLGYFRSFSSPNYAMHCQYNESAHQKEQLPTGINTIPDKMLTLFAFTFAKRQVQCIEIFTGSASLSLDGSRTGAHVMHIRMF